VPGEFFRRRVEAGIWRKEELLMIKLPNTHLRKMVGQAGMNLNAIIVGNLNQERVESQFSN
jgi:hypothetical protein